MKRTIKQWVYMSYEYLPDYSAQAWVPQVWSCRIDNNDERILIGEQKIVVDIPDDFNPIPAQVAVIERQKLEALEKYQRTVAVLQERLSKLLALEVA